MRNFFDYIGMIGVDNRQQVVTGIVRIVLAAVLGAIIGMERGRKHRPAGIKTHTLVCVAASLVMVTNEQLIYAYGVGDPTRMGAQVISGIGFLGAGTILTDRQNRIRGLTTAAGLWASACIGVAVGGGFYIGGIVTCILVLLIFTQFIDVESSFIRKSRTMELKATFDSSRNLNGFVSEITSRGCSITSFAYQDIPDEHELTLLPEGDLIDPDKIVTVNLQLLLPVYNYHAEIIKILESSKGLIMMEETE